MLLYLTTRNKSPSLFLFSIRNANVAFHLLKFLRSGSRFKDEGGVSVIVVNLDGIAPINRRFPTITCVSKSSPFQSTFDELTLKKKKRKYREDVIS